MDLTGKSAWIRVGLGWCWVRKRVGLSRGRGECCLPFIKDRGFLGWGLGIIVLS